MSTTTYRKEIIPAYKQVGKRQKLTGFIGELRDGNILLHSQEYSTNSQAEQALDRIVFDLLTDLAEHGLVDDVPAALEAEMVSSTHLPSWLLEAQEKVNRCSQDHPCDNPNHNHTGYRTPDADSDLRINRVILSVTKALHIPCRSCGADHLTQHCPAIRVLLFADPVVMVPDVEYAPFGFAA